MNSNNLTPNLMRRISSGIKRASWLGLLTSLAVTLLLALNPALSAFAAPGDLDPTFGTGGKVTTDFFGHTDAAPAVAIQSNGKIVAAGYSVVSGSDYDFALSRYNADGTLDNSFDADGKVTTPILSGADYAEAVAIQSDGKIVAAGFAYHDTTSFNDFALARYLPDGSLDTAFSGDGKVVTDFLGGNDEAKAVAIQSDGKIVAAGFARGPSSRNYFAISRYNSDGTLDTTFGTGGDGKVTTDFGNNATGLGMAVQSDGKTVVAGYVDVGVGNADFAMSRYNSDGTLDNSFDADGKVTTDFFGSYDTANALAIQSDGKILAAGSADHGANSNDFALARYLSDGSLDTTFSGNGKVFTDFGGSDVAYAVAIQSNGKIVAGGGNNGSIGDFAMSRFTSSGSLDSTFGTGGKVITDFSGNGDLAYALAIQGDGKIVAAGSTNSNSDFALARYDGDTSHYAPPTQTPGGPSVTPVPTTCAIEFTDVAPGSTFYDFVRCMACRGIINGYSSGCETGNPCFRPANNVTRGQLSKIVSNAAGFAEPAGAQVFEDVAPGSTFYDFVQRLASRSIIGGYACGGVGEPCVPPTNRPYFRPNDAVSRGQTSKIVAIAKGLPAPTPGQQTFEDVATNSTFWSWIEALSTAGAISGYPCGGPGEPCVPPQNRPYFRPGSSVTRGQSSKIVANTFFPNCQTP